MSDSIKLFLHGDGELVLSGAKSYARMPDVFPLTNLIETQVTSYKWLIEEGLAELFQEISPIVSYNGALEVYFDNYWLEEPTYTQDECRARDMTWGTPLHIMVRLKNRNAGGEITEQDVYLGELPRMTSEGSFVINGAERVVVSQLIRSPGAYFAVKEDRKTARRLCSAKLIPDRGAWLAFETSKRDVLSVKVDRKRKIPVTVLLRALGAVDGGEGSDLIRQGSDEEMVNLYAVADSMPDHPYLLRTIEKDPTKDAEAALIEFLRRMRPGDTVKLKSARDYLETLLFKGRRYDLGKVGRYKLNRRLHAGSTEPVRTRTLTKLDLIRLVERMIRINNGVEDPDDIDHLGNRRVRTVGELVQKQLRIGLRRMERMVRDRMSTRRTPKLTPVALMNARPIVGILRQFFGGSQLSQFMDQINPLSELTHKRRLSALGPGGLRRERAGFDVRDVHHTHYGRICPIETPEGPNIGLIGSLATYARISTYGFIETPYRRVLRTVRNDSEQTVGKMLREPVVIPGTGEVVAEAGTKVDEELALHLEDLDLGTISIVPVVTDEIEYLSADQEDGHAIAQANTELDEEGQFLEPWVSVHRQQRFTMETPDKIDYMDVSPKQIVSVSASLIPFLEHDDANRALMGSNMQRQAVPLVRPEVPRVGTGMETQAALDSGQVVLAEEDGKVLAVTGQRIVLSTATGEKIYSLRRYNRSNQSTCLDQHPIVSKGDRVERGQVLADSSSTDKGELALGQNVLVAFLSWDGANYEDAIVISERLVREGKFTSIHIDRHEVRARETRLGSEEITSDIPNVGTDALRNLDEHGVVYLGAEVGPGDILVGKITPKGQTELSPEEKLLRAIFGEKAWEVKDSSLRLPHGERGKVVDTTVFSREDHSDMPAGVDTMVRVSVAQERKISVGDKMAGRHGNKGVVSRIVAMEDMPFLEDGTPVDIILNPLGVPSRMNLGQVLECHLGWAASRLGFRAISPVFDGAGEDDICAELARAWLIDRAWRDLNDRIWTWYREEGIDTEPFDSDVEARRIYLKTHLSLLAESDDVDEIVLDRNRSRWAWMRQWLARKGYELNQICVAFNAEAT